MDYAAHPHIGSYLAACRKDRGLSVEALAMETRLKPAYIHAIEADDIDQLPGKAYARGYIKSYAEALELDGEAIIEHYAKQRDLHKQFQFYEPKKVFTAERPSTYAMRLSYMLLVVIGVAWVLMVQQQSDRPALVMAPPVEIVSSQTESLQAATQSACDEHSSSATPCYWQGDKDWTSVTETLDSIMDFAK